MENSILFGQRPEMVINSSKMENKIRRFVRQDRLNTRKRQINPTILIHLTRPKNVVCSTNVKLMIDFFKDDVKLNIVIPY